MRASHHVVEGNPQSEACGACQKDKKHTGCYERSGGFPIKAASAIGLGGNFTFNRIVIPGTPVFKYMVITIMAPVRNSIVRQKHLHQEIVKTFCLYLLDRQ